MKTQLFLISPEIKKPEAFRPALEAALTGGAAAALLLRFAGAGGAADKSARPLIALAQARGAAVLLEAGDDPRLAAHAGADGLHVNDPANLRACLETLKPERIAGAGRLKSRHDAMEAAEAGADYVLFGEPRADGSQPEFEQILERCQWWAEVFQTPCAGYAPRLEDIAALAATDIEFVALGDAVWLDARGPGAAVEAALAAIAGAAGARS